MFIGKVNEISYGYLLEYRVLRGVTLWCSGNEVQWLIANVDSSFQFPYLCEIIERSKHSDTVVNYQATLLNRWVTWIG